MAIDLSILKSYRRSLDSVTKAKLLEGKNLNLLNTDEDPIYLSKLQSPKTDVYYENSHIVPMDIIQNINNYRFKYKSPNRTIIGEMEDTTNPNNSKRILAEIYTAPSIFNPLFSVQINGFTRNTPLLQNVLTDKNKELLTDKNLDDCTIKELVSLSHKPNSILGNARYRYADFMYCKDLGKVSNNHLITLRKFPYPVGDHIGEFATFTSDDENYSLESVGDVGRLITWFGTDDNKLEDILKYEYSSSWKELKAEIDQIQSQENSDDRGVVGKIINTFTPSYNNLTGAGYTGGHSLIGQLAGNINVNANRNYTDETLRNYDQNKVYTPKNTVQDTYTYEGKLTLSHSFNLTFSYKLRAYDNINPKSAMLDLLANIYEVTYRRGKFWGGERKIIGPSPNTGAWNTANNFIDQAWDKLGNVFNAILGEGGGSWFGNILSSLSGLADSITNGAKEMLNNATDGAKSIPEAIKNINNKYGLSNALKGHLKNALGRPALYAMNSLLSASDVGLWHVTIGNPKRPIVSIGNLILEKASVQHIGPLGIDDFPSELKVTVTLKHARSRDLTELGKMYTQGLFSLYIPNASNNLEERYPLTDDQLKYSKTLDTARLNYQKMQNDTNYENMSQADKTNLEASGAAVSELSKSPAGIITPTATTSEFINSDNAFIAFTNSIKISQVRAAIDEIA